MPNIYKPAYRMRGRSHAISGTELSSPALCAKHVLVRSTTRLAIPVTRPDIAIGHALNLQHHPFAGDLMVIGQPIRVTP